MKHDLILDWAPSVLSVAGEVLGLAPIPGLSLVAEGLAQVCERVKVSLARYPYCFAITSYHCVP